MSDSRLVWFLLVDAADGKPYKGTSADKVSVAAPADVADFRDAVKTKYDQPGYLKEIPSGALLVYKNKFAFDKRNATEKDKEEPPLKSSFPLDGLGATEEDALVVVVPSLEQGSAPVLRT